MAMLAAGRSGMREVRGQGGAAPAKPRQKTRSERRRDARNEAASEPAEASDEDQVEEEVVFEADQAADEPSTANDFVDGSDADYRHLSKAERKRMRKMARVNGHAA